MKYGNRNMREGTEERKTNRILTQAALETCS